MDHDFSDHSPVPVMKNKLHLRNYLLERYFLFKSQSPKMKEETVLRYRDSSKVAPLDHVLLSTLL